MPNYEDGKIYKIFNSLTDDTYIGSTTQLLCNRMKNHRDEHNKQDATCYNSKLYKCFREHGVDNFNIELVEKYACSSKEELNSRKGYWIRQERPSLNTYIAGRTAKQYYEDNIDVKKQYAINYQSNNWEAHLNNCKKYREKPENKKKRKQYLQEAIKCECGCVITRNFKARHEKTLKHEQLMRMNTNT